MCTVEANDEFIMLTPEQHNKLPSPRQNQAKEPKSVLKIMKKLQRQSSPKPFNKKQQRTRKGSFQSVDFWEEDWCSMAGLE
jgi:hypothetical protein